MTERERVARAMAYFETCDDMALLRACLAEVAPKAKRLVAQYAGQGREDDIPGPADLRPAKEAATRDEAQRAARGVTDFPLVQVLARTIGRRIEAMEIAASADFPVGVRVLVPAHPGYPRKGAPLAGEVELTGTVLQVRLDNGETWQGPPSLAQLVRTA
jgi:hypothetical protein